MREIQYEVAEGIATIRLSAPKRKNALTPQMAGELVSAVEKADSDNGVGAIAILGGTSFCAGADLGTLDNVKTDPAGDTNFQAIEGIYNAFLRVGEAKPPTVAAVRGAAVGAGLNLALAADIRIVAHEARLLSGFARIGLHPGGGHFTLLTRAAGREAAAAIGLFGQEISGTRAAELGMAWRAVEDDEVEAVALNLARGIARDPALARSMVASFRPESGPPPVPWEVGVQIERARQMWTFRRLADGDQTGQP